MLEVLVGVVVLVFIVKSGLLTNLSVGIAPGAVPAPVAVAPQTAQQVAASLASNTQQETAVASGIQQGGTSIANSTLNSLGASTAAVPVVGAIFSILASSLIAASQKRAQEAKSENAAVATGVPAWDAAIAQVVAAYNNGSITNVQAQQLFTTIQSNYWNEVGPQIQPGRNGCNSGANCPPSQTPNSSTSINAGGNNYCSGNIGAA
jgi:hypothetical protein